MSDIVVDEVTLEKENHEVTNGSNEVCQVPNDGLEVSAVKNEYSIVGDSLYASLGTESAPQWLVNIIDNVVDGIIGGKVTDLATAISSINQSLLELDVAKNQYQELINIEATIDGVIATRLATINATVGANAANIVDLDVAKVDADQALAIVTNHLNDLIPEHLPFFWF